jgi:uncharacterized protein Veg
MFLKFQKTPFHFEDSWILLRYHPKWWAHMESSKPKNKSQVINLGEDEASQGAFVDLERPIGRKAEKEKCKTKEKTNPSVVAILNDMNGDKKKKIKLFEEAREQGQGDVNS